MAMGPGHEEIKEGPRTFASTENKVLVNTSETTPNDILPLLLPSILPSDPVLLEVQ